jgi:error-prone DNA polymerase
VPVENASMKDRSVIQWDKDDLEDMGLLKVDVLALGMLTAIRRCLDLVALRRGTPFTLLRHPDEDDATYDMICAPTRWACSRSRAAPRCRCCRA